MMEYLDVVDRYDPGARIVVYEGDCLELLARIPDGAIQLIVTSPPYNLGKEYEKRSSLEAYIVWQSRVIAECHRVLSHTGSICWQVGNYVEKGRYETMATTAPSQAPSNACWKNARVTDAIHENRRNLLSFERA